MSLTLPTGDEEMASSWSEPHGIHNVHCTNKTYLLKVDVVFTSHSRENISRTMDLRNPTVHKLIIIHQRYEPWPEMQDVLDKMRMAEKRALMRAQSCANP